MTPPPINIDGTDITGVTIDGQEVKEVTMDGNVVLSAGLQASGGDNVFEITQGGTDFRVHEFTSIGNGTLSIDSGGGELQYLVIAGGGGSGGRLGGGGGAGGYRSSVPGELSGGNTSPEPTVSVAEGDSISITVGNGGNASTGDNDNQTNGDDSILNAPTTTITSVGGGHGGGDNIAGGDGGSGGGSRGGRLHDPGQGTTGQGFKAFTRSGNEDGEGSGGGAGGEGELPQNSGGTFQAGGPGITSSITGTAVERAKGGDVEGPDGAANTGNGAGGSFSNSTSEPGQAGGSGIVIIRYEI